MVDRYLKPFCKELDRQIMSDGGHISRNPTALVELLLDLLPLRQCFMARDRVPPKQLSDAIDRAMPMVRFFRLGDGIMARFNGGGATATDSLATVLAYDDAGGAPLRAAPNSGYVRMERGTTLIIADVAAAPAGSLSIASHAGCLSFEMSSGEHPVIVNCGAPTPDHDDWRMFARSTSAHSTLTFEETSSAIFPERTAPSLPPMPSLSVLPMCRPRSTRRTGRWCSRARMRAIPPASASAMRAASEFSPDGLLVRGEDTLAAPKGLKGEAQTSGGGYAVRFHLHPSVSAEMAEDEKSVEARAARTAKPGRSPPTPRRSRSRKACSLPTNAGRARSFQIVLQGASKRSGKYRSRGPIERHRRTRRGALA